MIDGRWLADSEGERVSRRVTRGVREATGEFPLCPMHALIVADAPPGESFVPLSVSALRWVCLCISFRCERVFQRKKASAEFDAHNMFCFDNKILFVTGSGVLRGKWYQISCRHTNVCKLIENAEPK
jgi:hypothetical protein